MMITNLVFLVMTALAVAIMIGYAWYKAGSWSRMVYVFKHNKALADWKPFIGIAVALILGLTLVSQARADEPLTFMNWTEVSLGVDYVYNSSHSSSCDQDDRQFDDRLTGNGRIVQNVLTWHQAELNVLYQHHSCAINSDAHTYDAVGVAITRRWYW